MIILFTKKYFFGFEGNRSVPMVTGGFDTFLEFQENSLFS